MSKNKVEVIIDGTIYSLQGEESQEHIQKVARIINEKFQGIQEKRGKVSFNSTKATMLVALNVADEYVKTQQELSAYMQELQKCNAENLALQDRIKELTLELAQVKAQLASTSIQHKKNDHTNRGR